MVRIIGKMGIYPYRKPFEWSMGFIEFVDKKNPLGSPLSEEDRDQYFYILAYCVWTYCYLIARYQNYQASILSFISGDFEQQEKSQKGGQDFAREK